MQTDAIMSENAHTPTGQSARTEACCLYRLIGQDENTIEELRELIAVPPKTERALRAFARAHAADSGWIEAALKFREAVAREFEHLVREGLPAAELQEIEESEQEATTYNTMA
jgi:hypothetical protein